MTGSSPVMTVGGEGVGTGCPYASKTTLRLIRTVIHGLDPWITRRNAQVRRMTGSSPFITVGGEGVGRVAPYASTKTPPSSSFTL